MTLGNSTLDSNGLRGLYQNNGVGATTSITDSSISNSTYGVYLATGSASISGTRFTDNPFGIYASAPLA